MLKKRFLAEIEKELSAKAEYGQRKSPEVELKKENVIPHHHEKSQKLRPAVGFTKVFDSFLLIFNFPFCPNSGMVVPPTCTI